jgi:hypothetical protein
MSLGDKKVWTGLQLLIPYFSRRYELVLVELEYANGTVSFNRDTKEKTSGTKVTTFEVLE